jgi:hypothetical protein
MIMVQPLRSNETDGIRTEQKSWVKQFYTNSCISMVWGDLLLDSQVYSNINRNDESHGLYGYHRWYTEENKQNDWMMSSGNLIG